MKVEYDRLVPGKEGIEVAIRQAVRMFCIWLKPVAIDHIHEANLQVGEMLTKNCHCSESLHGHDVTGALYTAGGF